MRHSALLDLHRAAGAQLAPTDPPQLLTYGDVPAEYAAATERCAMFDESSRGLVAVSGADALVFLHRLLANTVRTLRAGQGNENLLLSSKGKVLFEFDLALESERVLLSTPEGQAGPLSKALDVYLFSEKVAIADVTEQHAPLALIGPLARELAARVLTGELPVEDHATVTASFGDAAARVTALPIAGSPGIRIDAGPEHAAELWLALRAAGAQPAGRIVRDSLRVEAGAAEAGIDVDDSVYPQEARLERAFSLDKGCYIGQEVVAKIDTYGGLNKRLVALRVSHDDPVPRGARLWRIDADESRDLGLVTSWAYSFALDTGLVLAYVKRRHQVPGTVFRLGDAQGSLGTATIVPLPVRAGAVPVTGEFE